jgi:bacillithiol biosynthesis deacetylase BshB1
LGSRGSAGIRKKEATLAAKMMGAKVRENVGLKDGFFDLEKSIMKIIPYIRKYQPDIVLANAISDRHPDHGRAAELISRACYLSGLLKIKTKIGKKAQQHWRPKQVFHYIQDRYIEPEFVVDITPYMDRKIELIKAYDSQFYNPKSIKYKNEAKTPISGKDFFDNLYSKANVFGRNIGVHYAEGFTAATAVGVNSLFDLS